MQKEKDLVESWHKGFSRDKNEVVVPPLQKVSRIKMETSGF